MSGYCLISAHLDPQNALVPAPISVMLFDSPDRGWEQLTPVFCRIDARRARELGDELLWLAGYAERIAQEERLAREGAA
jgi:hypothetical protein